MHIQSNLIFIYKQTFYYNKHDEIDTLFYEYHVPLLKDLDHPALHEEWKRNLDAASYASFLNKGIKLPLKRK